MIQAIIFDFGGVLNYPVDREAIDADLHALESEMGWEPRSWFKYIWGYDFWDQAMRGELSGDEAWRRVAESLGLSADVTGQGLCRRVLGPWEAIHPTMRDLVHRLKGRYRLAVISNTYEKDFAETFGERYGLPDHFDVIISSAAVGITKPDPRIYALTLERLGVPANEALFVDDNPKLAEGARAAGLAAIHFVNPEALLAELKTALNDSPRSA